MIDPPALSFAQRLKAATAAEHRRVERSGVMVAMLRGRIERLVYVSLMRNLHAIYAVLEPALVRHAARQDVGPVVMPELFRAATLERDLAALHAEAAPSPAALQPATAAYVEHLHELDASRPELLVSHAYVRYLGDLSGGQILRGIVSRALGLAGAEGTRFYDFGDSARVKTLAQRFRAGIEVVGQTTPDADAVVTEAESAFCRHGQLFVQLAARD